MTVRWLPVLVAGVLVAVSAGCAASSAVPVPGLTPFSDTKAITVR